MTPESTASITVKAKEPTAASITTDIHIIALHAITGIPIQAAMNPVPLVTTAPHPPRGIIVKLVVRLAVRLVVKLVVKLVVRLVVKTGHLVVTIETNGIKETKEIKESKEKGIKGITLIDLLTGLAISNVIPIVIGTGNHIHPLTILAIKRIRVLLIDNSK
jgi:hypothetical protein